MLFTQLAVLFAAVLAVAVAFPQGAYPDYKPAASTYSGGYAGGRVKIQAYRGPSSKSGDYGKSGDYDNYGFAPWGFYVNQPEDNKAYGY